MNEEHLFAILVTKVFFFKKKIFVPACSAQSESFGCRVRARTEAGWVCGLERWAEHGAIYASFRGVPYGKQPLGDLRFRVNTNIYPIKDTRIIPDHTCRRRVVGLKGQGAGTAGDL